MHIGVDPSPKNYRLQEIPWSSITFPVQLYLPAQGANGDENLTYSMAAELISLLDDMNI